MTNTHPHQGSEPINSHALILEMKKRLEAELDKYGDEERAWCDEKCITRFLVGNGYDINKGMQMLTAALKWRSEYKPYAIPLSEIKVLNKKGKIFRLPSYDKNGIPVVMIRLRFDSPSDGPVEERLRLVVYTIESTLRANPQSEKIGLIVDLSGVQTLSFDRHLVQNLLHTMQNNYVEQLGFCCMISAPIIFNILYALVSPFIDENTKQKIVVAGSHYTDKLLSFMDKSSIPKEYGGTLDFVFNYDNFE